MNCWSLLFQRGMDMIVIIYLSRKKSDDMELVHEPMERERETEKAASSGLFDQPHHGHVQEVCL